MTPMHAMEYGFTLPADFDMPALAAKVQAAVHLTDTLPGLGWKAYMFRHRGSDGSPVNRYASFYLWNDVCAMNRLLWGGGPFHRIVAYFGRPGVEHWVGAAFERGPAIGTAPRSATRSTTALPQDIDPAPAIARAADDLATMARSKGVHSVLLAVDPRAWELLRFTLWSDAAPADASGDRYQVFHFSQPELAAVPIGRQW
jgi:hypothetical protein